MTAYDRRFARDVARQMDRRRGRRKLLLFLLLIAAIALAITRLDCGNGLGLGLGGLGLGGDDTDESVPTVTSSTEAAARRCALRVTSAGITIDGKRGTLEQAVAACKPTAGADVVVTGDARHGDWVELEASLKAAGVPVFKRDAKQPPDRSGSAAGSSP